MKGIYWLGLLGIASFQAFFINPCFAQSSNIIPDNSLGAESSQKIENFQGLPVEVITGGAQRGINLFHSFQEFNVSEGRGAYFFSPNAEIQNILTRVTGRNPSEILGTLGTFGNSQLNLFLINPNGIVFGENSSLDVGGSFVANTANGINLGETGLFSATEPTSSNLLSVNPSALFFNAVNNQAEIQNNSIAPAGTDPAGFDVFGLRVADGKNLLLVGGDVSMDGGQLNAYGGRVELGGLAAPGNVNLLFDEDNLKLGFPENVTRADVSLTNQAFVYVEADGGGDIAINARNLDILQGSKLSAGIGRGLGTPETVAGDIVLNATGEIKVAGAGSNVFNDVRSESKGNGGNITIDSGSFLLRDSARLRASIYGNGNAGDVKVTAKDAVSLSDNAYIFNTVEAGGVGKGGNIDINAPTLTLRDGAQLQTITRGASITQPPGKGDAGNINLKVSGAVDIAGKRDFASGLFSYVDTGTKGNGGNITIDSGSFSLTDGARLRASIYGNGNAGDVTVSAKDAISLTGNTYILSTVEAGGEGQGGDIDINAATLSLTDGAQLQTITRGASITQPPGKGDAGNINLKVSGAVDIAGKRDFASGLFSYVDTGTKGNGGNITIDSGSFSLTDGARLQASTYGIGDAGNVKVTAKDAVSLSDNAYIFSTVEAGGVGKGGNIDINAPTLTLRDGAQLQTITRGASDTQPPGKGDAGNINLKVSGAVDIAGKRDFASGLRSGVQTGTRGNGGNITVDADSFNLAEGAEFSASTSGNGNAGNVKVRATEAVSLVDANILSTVEAGGTGKGGNIDINAATLSLTDSAQLLTLTRGASDNDTQPPGQGDAGNVNVKVTGLVDIAGDKNGSYSAIYSSVDTGTFGNGGNITINSGSFSLRDGAVLETSTSGNGNAGNVKVRATEAVSLVDANILSTVEAGGTGKGGNIDINAATLSLIDSAQLQTITREASDTQPPGQGSAGNVNVKVTGLVDIAGDKNGSYSGIYSSVNTGTEGNGGNITIDSGSFLLRDGASIDTRTRNDDLGGNITVNTDIFEALNGGQLIAATSSDGSAGKITVNATQKAIVSGSDPNYNNLLDYVNLLTQLLDYVVIIGVNSGLFVSSSGLGDTGDIEVNSPQITLDNQGTLNANSASGNGGNINLTSDLLLMRRGAQISTNAGRAEQGGDGGNIDINSKFIIALPQENSDITANAFSGTGGNVNIFSQGIFGIEPRQRQNDATSDITASSDLGVPGVLNLTDPDDSSIRNNLDDLPENQIDTNALIANSCISRSTNRQENSFKITGSGGLRNSPGDGFISEYSTGDVRNVEPKSQVWKKGDAIIEPTGVYKLSDGRILLSRGCSFLSFQIKNYFLTFIF